MNRSYGKHGEEYEPNFAVPVVVSERPVGDWS
jgi:hypothetical protein